VGERVIEDGDWLTLREASEATGVPTSTIRKWARHENIPSFLDETDEGALRMVSMTGIQEWANEIGRKLETTKRPATPRRRERMAEEIDLTTEEDDDRLSEVPEGSMLVPLDAWNRMLNQLGNLHEAGQQLAEARERAAKAETEALFLRERMREMRGELQQMSEKSEDQPTDTADEPSTPTSLLRRIYRDWRRTRRS
jgi:DNA-binding transcriptional MerR regulator